MKHARQFKAAAATAVLLAAAVIAWSNLSPPPAAPRQDYFLNLGTGELIALPAGAPSPHTTPDGDVAVRAFVYSCGRGCGPASRAIAYLEKYDDDVLPLIGKAFDDFDQQEAANRRIVAGLRVAAPPSADGDREPRWLDAAGPEGQSLLSRPRRACADNLTVCLP